MTILVYAYLDNVYSSRRIEACLKENIHYMWVSGIAPEAVKQAIEKIDQAIKDKQVDKKVTQKIKYAKKNWPENLKRYEDQEKILPGRKISTTMLPKIVFIVQWGKKWSI